MTDLLLFSAIAALWQFGFNHLFAEGMVLEKLGDWLRGNLSPFVAYPLFDCVYCMSSLHAGTGWILLSIAGYVGPWYAFPVASVVTLGVVVVVNEIGINLEE